MVSTESIHLRACSPCRLHFLPVLRDIVLDKQITQLLERAFAEASKLPEPEQDAVASVFLAELHSEQRWTQAFASSQVELLQLADEALREFEAGETLPIASARGMTPFGISSARTPTTTNSSKRCDNFPEFLSLRARQNRIALSVIQFPPLPGG